MKGACLAGLSLVVVGCVGEVKPEPLAPLAVPASRLDPITTSGPVFHGTGGSFGAPAPVEPVKADEVRPLSYRLTSGEGVEVEGVCRYSETAVSCWDGKGKSSSELTSIVRKNLESVSFPITFVYKRKNRLIVMRRRELPTGSGLLPSLTITPVSVGQTNFGVTSMGLNFSGAPNSDAGFRTSYEGRFVSDDLKATEATLRIARRSIVNQPIDLPLKRGANVRFGSYQVFVDSIKPVPGGDGPGQKVSHPAWTIRLRRVGWDSRQAAFSAALDQRTMYVDEHGELVSGREYGKWVQKIMEEAHRTHHAFRLEDSPLRKARILGQSISRDWIELEVNVDPASMGSMPLQVSVQKTVDLVGIPLDPKSG